MRSRVAAISAKTFFRVAMAASGLWQESMNQSGLHARPRVFSPLGLRGELKTRGPWAGYPMKGLMTRMPA